MNGTGFLLNSSIFMAFFQIRRAKVVDLSKNNIVVQELISFIDLRLIELHFGCCVISSQKYYPFGTRDQRFSSATKKT